MNYLHLTPTKNLSSIFIQGLKPSYIYLDHHWESFKKELDLKERKLLYTWVADYKEDNFKFVKDMIYCKLFINPRNKYFDYHYKTYNDYFDFRRDNAFLYGIDTNYTLLKIKAPCNNIRNLHSQYSFEDDIYGSCYKLDDNYAHNDKLLGLFSYTIHPRDIEVVEEYHTHIYNNKKVDIRR